MRRMYATGSVLAVLAACSHATGPAGSTLTHPAGTPVSPAAVGARPFGVAISSQDVALVGRQDVPFLQRSALPSTAFADSVRVGSDPDDIAFNSTGSRAYSTNLAGQTLNVIDIARGLAIDTLPILAGAVRVLVAPNDGTVYVSAADGTVYAYNTASLTVAHSWTLRGVPNGLALSPSGATVYVSSTGGELYRFNANATGAIDSVSILGTPQDIALTANGNELFVANEGGSLQVRNGTTLALIDTVPGAAGAFGLKATPDGVQLYATYPGSGQIRIIDRSTRSVIGTLPVGGTPRRVAFGQGGAVALIPNEGGFVTVVH